MALTTRQKKWIPQSKKLLNLQKKKPSHKQEIWDTMKRSTTRIIGIEREKKLGTKIQKIFSRSRNLTGRPQSHGNTQINRNRLI